MARQVDRACICGSPVTPLRGAAVHTRCCVLARARHDDRGAQGAGTHALRLCITLPYERVVTRFQCPFPRPKWDSDFPMKTYGGARGASSARHAAGYPRSRRQAAAGDVERREPRRAERAAQKTTACSRRSSAGLTSSPSKRSTTTSAACGPSWQTAQRLPRAVFRSIGQSGARRVHLRRHDCPAAREGRAPVDSACAAEAPSARAAHPAPDSADEHTTFRRPHPLPTRLLSLVHVQEPGTGGSAGPRDLQRHQPRRLETQRVHL